MRHDVDVDVAILGSGMGGSVLAALLARHGRSVALIDKTAHPRFAIGESTIVYTTQLLASLSERFDVPEIAPRADPAEVAMAWIGPPEFHLYRPDVDAYLFRAAVDRGATRHIGVGVSRVEADAQAATVHFDDGTTLRARMVIDGTGHRSVLGQQHGLRMEDPGLHTHTRSLFTHMVGVSPFDTVMPRSVHGMPGPLHEGTLHHVFDGGWLWVIPFDNHRGADNPLVSVGLQLDSRRHPLPADRTPAQEFADLLARFPSIAAQFEGAEAVRPWVRTGRLQFASTTAVPGPRQALLPHAYGFIDPLYSRGLAFTLDGVKHLAQAILAVDDPGDADLSGLDARYRELLDAHDELTHGSLVSWRDPALWNTWWTLWLLSTVAQFFVMLGRHRWRIGRDDTLARAIDHHPIEHIRGYDALMKQATAWMVEVDAGRLDPSTANAQIQALLAEQPFYYAPVFEHLRTQRMSRPPSMVWDLPGLTRFGYWVGTHPDPDLRDLVMPFVRGMVFRYAWTTV